MYRKICAHWIPHSALMFQGMLELVKWDSLDHPSYSLDLTPSIQNIRIIEISNVGAYSSKQMGKFKSGLPGGC